MCQVTRELDTYLDALEKQERADDDLQRRIDELMEDGGEYDPLDPDNLALAVSETDNDGGFWSRLSEMLRDNMLLTAGDAIKSLSFDYWYKHAKTQAEAEQERAMQEMRNGER